MDENSSLLLSKFMFESRRKLNLFTSNYNITGKQSRILHYIYEESLTKEINQKEIEKAFGIRGASVTSILQTLEKKKLIARKESKIDARRKILTVTSKGKEVYFNIRAKIEAFEKIMFCGISENEVEALIKTVKKILKNLVACTVDNKTEYDLIEVSDE